MANLKDSFTVGILYWGIIAFAILLKHIMPTCRWDGENIPIMTLEGFHKLLKVGFVYLFALSWCIRMFLFPLAKCIRMFFFPLLTLPFLGLLSGVLP